MTDQERRVLLAEVSRLYAQQQLLKAGTPAYVALEKKIRALTDQYRQAQDSDDPKT